MLSELIWVWSGMNFSAGIWQSGLWNQFCKNDVVAIVHPWCYLAACFSTAVLTWPFTATKTEAQRSLNNSMAESQCSSHWIIPHILCVHLLAKDSAMLLTIFTPYNRIQVFHLKEDWLVMLSEHCAQWNESHSTNPVCKEDRCGCGKSIWWLE